MELMLICLHSGGLFWFGWTGYTGRILWVVPVLSGLFTGFGIFAIFLSPSELHC